MQLNRDNLQYYAILLSVCCLVLCVCVAFEINLIFSITLTVWTGLLIYTLLDIKNNIAAFLFLIAFYILLLGREVAHFFFSFSRHYIYSTTVDEKSYYLLIISLIGFFVGVKLAENCKTIYDRSLIQNNKAFSKYSRNVFLFCLAIAIIRTLERIRFVMSVGYVNSYTTEYTERFEFLMYFSAFSNLALCMYLASKPEKKETIKIFALYEIYLVLTMFTGIRATIVIGNFIMIIYFVIRDRHEGGWISKRVIRMGIIALPVVFALLYLFDFIRTGRAFESRGLLYSAIDFFDQQGGSINNIKRVVYYKDSIIDLNLVSFNSLHNALFENAIARQFIDIKVYTSNSIETATMSNSLPHRLSYLVYGGGYLSGHGTGSSYIAELFHDFGFVGVLIGNIIYGFLLKKASQINFKNIFADTIVLVVCFSILYAPRNNFDGFITEFFTLHKIVFSALAIFVYLLIYERNYKIKLR